MATSKTARDEDLTLWYARPAGKWTEALPLGNGRFGAMVFGGVRRERIQLNEDTLWAGHPVSEYCGSGRGGSRRRRAANRRWRVMRDE
ncbi:hypothetical protein J6TS7_07620 [Paenibacillus dendritiformis]|nr:hypothetical protein J6TS7_07620 [Paenibacillus dendritiformis]